MVKRYEGYREAPYFDSLHIPTIGYGHNLQSDKNRGELEKNVANCGLDSSCKKKILTDTLHKDLNTAVKNAEKLPYFHKQPADVKNVLIDMNFNMGPVKVTKFKEMGKALDKGDYKKAAEELKDSKYYKQTGHRAKEHYGTLYNQK